MFRLMNEGGGPPETKPNPPAEYLTRAEFGALMQQQQKDLGQMFSKFAEALKTPAPAERKPEETKHDFYTKPEEAAAKLFDQKMEPYVSSVVLAEKTRQLQEVKALPCANDYMGEIAEILDKMPPAAQIQPGMAREAYNMVIGRHLTEVRQKMAEAEARKPEFTETHSSGAPPAPRGSDLTPDEKRVADGMGISHKEYKEWRDNPQAMADAALAGKKS